MRRVLFYFDKDCIEKANEKLDEILMENGLISGFSVLTSCSDSNKIPDRKKEWLSFNFDNGKGEDLHRKANDIIRNFNWESVGITGFDEVKVDYSYEEREVEIKMVGLMQIPLDGEKNVNDIYF